MSVLINTKLRKKLLAYTFAHHDESFYVRQLAVLIGEDAGNLSRELRKLQDDGLYTSYIKGGAKFYSLNKSYSLFKELKTIISKTEGAEGRLKGLILKYKSISLAFIYGSYAKNKEKNGSDIDLVVVGKFNRDNFTDGVRNLESELSREINFTAYDEEEFEKERKKEGSFLNLVLKGKTIILKDKIDDK